MKCIKNEVKNTIIINKSTFITYLIPVDSLVMFEDNLNRIKKENKDATHYCYAYIIGSNEAFNDDGEPSGTAGLPILDILKKKDLHNVLCVVVRYFGGIKLGSGGLIRAYRKSALEASNIADICSLVPGYYIKIEVSYYMQKEVEMLIDNYKKEYQESVIYSIYCDIETYNNLKKYKILEEVKQLIKK